MASTGPEEPARLRLLALFVSRSTAARGRPAPGGALAKRPLAGGRERQHRAETEDVARRADHASLRLFRGHEPGRAHDRARHWSATLPPAAREMPKSITRGPSSASSTFDGLQVTVHHAGGVDRGQALGQSRGQRQHRAGWQRPVRGHRLGQRRPGDVGGRQPRHRAVRVRVDHQRREQAADLPGRGDLAREPGPEPGLARPARAGSP